MKYLLLIALVYASTCSQAQHSLTVTIEGIASIKGQIAFCLNQDKGAFPEDCVYKKRVKIDGNTIVFTMDNIESGTYAASVYHDINSDEKLNTNLVGIPKEKYGFSNNPNSTFGIPDFEKCTFKIPSTTSISIKI